MLTVAQSGRGNDSSERPWACRGHGGCWLSGDAGYGAGTTAVWQAISLNILRYGYFSLTMKKMRREDAANGSRWDRHPGRCHMPVNKVQKENKKKIVSPCGNPQPFGAVISRQNEMSPDKSYLTAIIIHYETPNRHK